MKILIDARLYGLENAGLGRYVSNLVSELSQIDNKNKYYILLRKKYFDSIKLPKSWTKVLADFRHYSYVEQIKLPMIINEINPDLTHFPHFNVPIFFTGKFIVTIHDMLMHNQKGFDATTLNPLSYLAKRLGYRFIFWWAVTKAKKIIVPSNVVAREIISYYKIDKKKVEVTYEA